MWQYEKKLQYPVNIKNPNPKLAEFIVSQLGGPDGEMSASLRYLNQRYAAPYGEVRGVSLIHIFHTLEHQLLKVKIIVQLWQLMNLLIILKTEISKTV